MPRFRLGNIKVAMEPTMPPPPVLAIPEEVVEILNSFTDELLTRFAYAMRNGTPGEPTSSEKGVLRRIVNENEIEMADLTPLSWSGPYMEQYR